MKTSDLLLVLLMLALSYSTTIIAKGSDEKKLNSLADKYMALVLNTTQPYSYFNDLKVKRHNKFLLNTPKALLRAHKQEDRILRSLRALENTKWQDEGQEIFYVKFVEALEANVQMRVCKSELWNVNHMFGSHSLLDFLIQVQPVSNDRQRRDAISRWSVIPDYYAQEIINLKQGLLQGYSAPKRVVKRLVDQLQSLTSIKIDEHPYLALAKRADNKKFAQTFKTLIKNEVLPAIKKYSDYLQSEYLPQARSELGIHALPNGRACYMAQYRQNTSLSRTPEQVFKLGLKTVNENKSKVIELGKSLYNVDTFKQAVKQANADGSQRFSSSQQMHAYFVAAVARAKTAMPEYFYNMPDIELMVEAIPKYQQGSGQSAHYVPGNDDRDAKFSYDPTTSVDENYATAEIVSFHEGYPGHHMQIALVQNQQTFHPIEVIFSNSAYIEGWARYAESLSEEAGLYQSKSAKILRRAWPARGMVADVTLHIMGWSNERVADFIRESGASFANDTDVMLDRMAVMPAQLTSYDSGALEIFALRKQMQEQMGDKFNIKDFHQAILKYGSVPMSQLRKQMDNKKTPH
jgi:uncharacterized protein (DUF885 family)